MTRITIRGKHWRLRFCRLPRGVAGECDHPGKSRKEVRINCALRGERLLDTLIHEMLHAAQWDLCEESIDETATDIARVLARLGAVAREA